MYRVKQVAFLSRCRRVGRLPNSPMTRGHLLVPDTPATRVRHIDQPRNDHDTTTTST